MKNIGIVYDRRKIEARDLASSAAEWLRKQGHKVFLRLSEDILNKNMIDAVITFGGDGTVLRAANMVVERQIPILRVNFGKEGFLTNIEPHEIYDKLKIVFDDKNYIKQKRNRLQVIVRDQNNDILLDQDALNDIVIERSDTSVISCSLETGGNRFEFVGDAFIFAPRTGSTAYHESAGGRAITREDKIGFKVASPSNRDGEDRLIRAIDTVFMVSSVVYKARLNIDGHKKIKRMDEMMKIEIKKSERFTIFMEIGDFGRMRGD
ncbi:MAG: NAD(+)/NADH kinase [Minisyncoccia bacterium]